MKRFKVVGSIEARVTVYVDANTEEEAFAAASDQWVFDDVDCSQGMIYNPAITEVKETTVETHYGPTAPAAWFIKGGDASGDPIAS